MLVSSRCRDSDLHVNRDARQLSVQGLVLAHKTHAAEVIRLPSCALGARLERVSRLLRGVSLLSLRWYLGRNSVGVTIADPENGLRHTCVLKSR